MIKRREEVGAVLGDELTEPHVVTDQLMGRRPLRLRPDRVHGARVWRNRHCASVAATYDAEMDTVDVSEITLGMLVTWAVLIASAAVVAYLVYRSMDRPLLALTPTPAGPRATPRSVVTYIIVTPLLVALWWAFFTTVLLLSDNTFNATQLLLLPIALIIAVRTLVFIAPGPAHELAKILPIALIAVVILGGGVRPVEDYDRVVDELEPVGISGASIMLLFLYDYVLTTIWYWGWIRWGRERWTTRRSKRSVQQVADDDGGVAVLTDTDGADRGA
jgi:hypothetical protein